MSVFGKRTAVISLGVSCQTAWQIKKQAGLLSELAGEPLNTAAGPFDWLIMPPVGFTSWMAAGARFPASPAEIVIHPNFYWPRHNLHFWHEFTTDGAVALHDTFDRTRAKFDHLLGKLAAIRACERRVFFVSNTQSNLDEVRRVSPVLDFTFTRPAMTALLEAVRARFGGGSEVHFVTRADRLDFAGDASGFNLHVLEAASPDILGCDAEWEGVFCSALDPALHRRAA